MIQFSLPIKPKAQARHRSFGKRMYDPSVKDKKKVILLSNKYAPKEPSLDSLMVQLTFNFKRPKSHYRTGKYKDLLKPNAPEYMVSKPDCDNLAKLILDSYNNIFYKDDSQIIQLQIEKKYAEEDRVDILISNSI